VNIGSLVLGVLSGMLTGLLAVGLVLVFRSSKFLNLAQGQIGALPALLLSKVVIDWGWNYWVALFGCLLLGTATGVVVERLFVAKLRKKTSSAISFLLLTLGITELLTVFVLIQALDPNQVKLASQGYPVPWHISFTVGGVVMGSAQVMILIICPVLVVALALFLRFSLLGKMIRAAASNRENARLCGISPSFVSALTWGIAGALSAITAVLVAPSQGGQFSAGSLGPEQLFLALGAAALGGFVSIPMALIGGLVIGIVDQIALSQTSNGGTATLVVFVLILCIVLVRGRLIASAFSTSGTAIQDRSPLQVPAVLRRKFVVRRQAAFLAAFGLLLALLLPFLPYLNTSGNQFQLSLVLVYAIVSVSLTMLIGWGGQLSLGQFAIVGIGAFIAGRLATHGLGVVPLLLITGLLGAVVMLVVGLPALRVRGLTLAVTTLGLGVVASEWLFQQAWFTGSPSAVITVGPLPIFHGQSTTTGQLFSYFLVLIVLVVVGIAARGLRRSTPGRSMIAVRDNENAAAANGLTPTRIKLLTLAVSGFIAASAGVLWANVWSTVSANQFPPDLSLSVLAAPLIGGLGSIAGAIAGAVAVYLPTFFLSPFISGLFGQVGAQQAFQDALAGLGLIGVVLGYPTGIAGAVQSGWQILLNRAGRKLSASPAADRLTIHAEPATSDSRARSIEVAQRPAPARTVPSRSAALPVLDVAGIEHSFGGIRALRNVSIKVQPGTIVGLIGPNGAGKTTLINVISGLLRPSAGTVELFGTDISRLAPAVRARHGLGRTFQSADLFPGLTVREALQTMIAARRGIGVLSSMSYAPWARRAERAAEAEANALIEQLGLAAWADMLTGELSTGTRRICELALQFAAKPAVLLLDEPTSGVAQRESEAFAPLLRRMRDEIGCAMLIVEHDMPFLMGVCGRVYAMETGSIIAEGTPSEIRGDPLVIASYLGTDMAAANTSQSNPESHKS
jgi:ABC-type branched-subunit amino acid transport system ATPase component/ABC-type branched-subunit amino acid transport system permease subunit